MTVLGRRAVGPSGRSVGAAAFATAVLGLTVLAAAIAPDPSSGINRLIEALSSGSSDVVGAFGRLLPFGFAFAAGMVAAVNPCGFVLLPATLGMFLAERDERDAVSLLARVRRALDVGASLTVGVVGLFAVIGLLVGGLATIVVAVLPWLGLSVGVILVVLGGYRLAGGALYSSLPDRVSAALSGGFGSGRAPASGRRRYVLFGVAYGTASLSCTLPIFLAVLGGSLTEIGLASAVGRLVAYGLGLGAFVMGATVAIGFLKGATLSRLRGASRWVEQLGTGLLVAAGAYLVYYWLTLGGLLRH